MGIITMWQDILKINMEEARRLGNTYSPDDMGKAVDVSMDSIFDEAADEILQLVSGEVDLNLKSSIKAILDETRLRVKNYLRSD
jgi:hypothetical protein|tara:strand:+ start:1446 stop:1697 length:252 start_codon:yes stop_codon:yes gene_type:complete